MEYSVGSLAAEHWLFSLLYILSYIPSQMCSITCRYGKLSNNGKTPNSDGYFCPQLVSVPLTGLERMLSSSLNMDLSLPTSKGFTCLTVIIAAVVELARHFTMPRSVFTQCLGI
ncbi:hypothetical protein AVEN_124252-1 [Araneus ventricosus]|uniref:Uncharacterized protein n=1 Tax=Araneus ventricosus TaxID=182803 RepID=A0A4Y2UZ55_ARAVE|nr:hypothetical protein AVEN_124252-1 [Araneus ventricosus]